MTKAPPAWLLTQLIADGDLTADRITRKPRPRRCPSCGRRVLTAIRSMSGDVVRCELAPTTSEGELIALMNGRRTFLVTEFYGIELRFDFDILGLPADRAGSVHGEHRCGATALPVHPEFRASNNRRLTDKTDTIPF